LYGSKRDLRGDFESHELGIDREEIGETSREVQTLYSNHEELYEPGKW
jgi:hypothetical protein